MGMPDTIASKATMLFMLVNAVLLSVQVLPQLPALVVRGGRGLTLSAKLAAARSSDTHKLYRSCQSAAVCARGGAGAL